MMTYAQYLEGNRQALDKAESETGQDPAASHGHIMLLAMHRIGRVSHALATWAAIRHHGKEVEHAEQVDGLRRQVLDFAAHATVLLERIARRVEADAPPQTDDAAELCEVTAYAHRCTEAPGCPSCDAQQMLALRREAYEAEQAAASKADRELN